MDTRSTSHVISQSCHCGMTLVLWKAYFWRQSQQPERWEEMLGAQPSPTNPSSSFVYHVEGHSSALIILFVHILQFSGSRELIGRKKVDQAVVYDEQQFILILFYIVPKHSERGRWHTVPSESIHTLWLTPHSAWIQNGLNRFFSLAHLHTIAYHEKKENMSKSKCKFTEIEK